ncbi:MAG: hypothetical protein AAFV51_05100 [Pseudomonadota bacterium]
MTGSTRCFLTLAASALAFADIASADDFSLNIGQDFSDGDYGQETESQVNVTTFGGRLRLGDWSFAASSGYIDLGSEPDNIITLPGGREILLSEGEEVKGFTDLVLSASGLLREETDSAPGVFLFTSVKLPTADDENGLGTGAADYSASLELSKTFGSSILYAYGGGRLRGESDVIETRDSLNAGLGVQQLIGTKLVGALSYDYRGASFEGGDDAQEATLMLSWLATERLTISGYVYTGFTDASPDLGAGLFVSHKIFRW